MASQSQFAYDTSEAAASPAQSVSETVLRRAEADEHTTKTLAGVEEQSAAEQAKEIQEIENNMVVALSALELMEPLQDDSELALDREISERETINIPDSALSLSQVCSIIVNDLLQADQRHVQFSLLSELCLFCRVLDRLRPIHSRCVISIHFLLMDSILFLVNSLLVPCRQRERGWDFATHPARRIRRNSTAT